MTKRFWGRPIGFKVATIFVALTLIKDRSEKWPRAADAPRIRFGNARWVLAYRCLATSLALLPLTSGATTLEAPPSADPPESDRLIQDRKVEEQGARANPPIENAEPPVLAAASTQAVNELAAVQVTGTRIKGGSVPSPVITIGGERIQEEGFTDLGEVIRSIPQNFSGGQNPGVLPFTTSGAGVQNQNITGGAALNLRGLGPDASLTLLNGRRMAYGGLSQAVDIDAIPVEAVERIEIVPDGASAIYGSDAVGGVANVILKRDFDGAAVGARFGSATDGGLTTREYSATTGTRWDSGGVVAAFKTARVDPIYADQRAYTDFLRDPYTIYPGSKLESGLVSGHQSLGEIAEVRLDAYRTRRSQAYTVFDNVANRYVEASPKTTTTLVAPGIDVFLRNDWTLSIDGALSRSDHIQRQSNVSIAGDVLSSIDQCYCSRGSVYEIGAEGPVFTLASGQARLAAGTGYRTNRFLQRNYLTGAALIEGEQHSRFGYAEISLPLVGAGSAAPGVHRLDFTAAVRGEDYDSFGGVVTPKLGLIYAPDANFTFRASWGRSFKAPTLVQLYRAQGVVYSYASAWGGEDLPAEATVLFLDGGNQDLKPERARTMALTLAFHPEAVPGLEAELTWFNIGYTDRVVQPITIPTQALSNPAFAEFVSWNPTAQEKASVIARDADGVVTDMVGAPYAPDGVVAIVYYGFQNAAEQKIRGLDLSGSYRWDVAAGQLTLRGSASWLDSAQRISITKVDLSGVLSGPPDVTGRLGVVWGRGALTASTFANYKSGVLDPVRSEKTASFTTVDTTLRYALGARDGAGPGWELAGSVQNVFDRAPPLNASVTSYLVPPYDATNYSAIGRYVDVSVSKRW